MHVNWKFKIKQTGTCLFSRFLCSSAILFFKISSANSFWMARVWATSNSDGPLALPAALLALRTETETDWSSDSRHSLFSAFAVTEFAFELERFSFMVSRASFETLKFGEREEWKLSLSGVLIIDILLRLLRKIDSLRELVFEDSSKFEPLAMSSRWESNKWGAEWSVEFNTTGTSFTFSLSFQSKSLHPFSRPTELINNTNWFYQFFHISERNSKFWNAFCDTRSFHYLNKNSGQILSKILLRKKMKRKSEGTDRVKCREKWENRQRKWTFFLFLFSSAALQNGLYFL